MRYINGIQFDPRHLLDTHRTFEQAWNRHRVILSSLGTPITVFYSHGRDEIDDLGMLKERQRCHCSFDQNGNKKDPDPDHRLCYGEGVLPGFEKYGYNTIIVTNTTKNVVENNVAFDGPNQEGTYFNHYTLDNSETSGEIISPNYVIDSFYGITFFKFAQKNNPEQNRVRYYYSTDNGSTWVNIPVTYDTSGKPTVDFSAFPEELTQIKFRILMEKRYTHSSSPKFSYLKFRYQSTPNLSEIDTRFKEIDMPATLTAYSISPQEVKQAQQGLTVSKEPTWWTLPESRIGNDDMIMYLNGHYKGRMFYCYDIEERIYAKFGYPLSLQFKTRMLRDSSSNLGIRAYLADESEFTRIQPFTTFNMNAYYPEESELTESHYKSRQP